MPPSFQYHRSAVGEDARVRTQPLPAFEIRQALYQGTHTQIWEAFDRAQRRKVALKVLMPHALQTEALRQSFRREAALLEKLRHRYVLETYASFDSDRRCFIALEYMHGNLYTLRQSALRAQEIIRLMGRVLSVLAYCHSLGIAHRDVKPSNILVRKDPDGWVLKLADFDAAITFNLEGIALLTEADRVKPGTISFWPPEKQARYQALMASADRDWKIDSLSTEICDDIYATALSLKKLLASRVSQVPGLDQLLAQALHDRPEERFSSALAFKRALLALID